MKFKIFIILLLLILNPLLRAQLKIGITGGINYSDALMEPDKYSTLKVRKGITAGIIAGYPLSNHFSLDPSIGYVQKGCVEKLYLSGDEYDNETKFDFLYLNIPLKYFILVEKSFKPFVSFGPELDIKYSYESVYRGTGIASISYDTDNNKESSYGKSYESYDIAMVFGLGCEYALNKYIDLIAGMNYSFGMRDLAKSFPEDTDHISLRLNCFSISMGIKFAF
jgi:hypothetical protein